MQNRIRHSAVWLITIIIVLSSAIPTFAETNNSLSSMAVLKDSPIKAYASIAGLKAPTTAPQASMTSPKASPGASHISPIRSYGSMTLLKKGGKSFDLRAAARQKLYRYDTLQGACANSGYGYFTLYNRNVEKCKIVKVDLDAMEVVKVSKPLPVYHANNLTFNTKKNLIVATCCRVKDKRAVFIDPETLKVAYKKDIKLKASKKIPKSVVKSYRGFTAIAYNEKHDCYVGRLRDNNNVIIFNGDMKPLRYVVLKGKRTYLLNQGMESIGDYIYDVRSFKGNHKNSTVTIHTMSGKYLGKMNFKHGKKPGRELECIFHDGDRFYAGFYYTTNQKHDYRKYKVKRYNYIYKLNHSDSIEEEK